METEKVTEAPETGNPKEEYPPKKQVIPAMVAIYLTVFLIALDRTILGTAVPRITDEFNSFGDVSWYESGFLLPLCIFSMTFGLLYTFYSAKWIMVALVAVFEIGSIVCATAPNSPALIAGRVITGIGGAGITSGGLILVNILLPLDKRPKYAGGIGAMFGLASILGPLLGGYLTAVTWRWCFWINVPIGGVAIVTLILLCPNKSAPSKPASTLKGRLMQLDPIGFLLLAPSIVCLLFALQWGTQYSWSDDRVIALFVVCGVLLIAFIGSQMWGQGRQKMLPGEIILQRTMFAASFASIGIGSILVMFAYYLPIWLQVVQEKSPQSAGLSLLPLLLSQVILVMITGGAISYFGYYTPFLILGSVIAIIGAALISTWEPHIGPSKWIGYQVVMGIGIGFVLMQPNIAAQTVLSKTEAPIGLTFLSFLQFLGGTIFITVAQVLLDYKLLLGLNGRVSINPEAILNGGATSLRQQVSEDQVAFVLQVYNDSMKSIWYLGLALSCLVFVTAFGFEWKNVKKETEKQRLEQEENRGTEV